MSNEEIKKENEENESVASEETLATGDSAEEKVSVEEEKKEEKPVEIDWKDQYARLMADFDNFKKRTARERDDLYRYAEADVLKDLLPTVDNLELALSKAENPEDPFVKGVQLVRDTLLAMMKTREAESFESVGQALDIEKMEAVAQLPNAEVEEGIVSNEVKRGWMLKGKVLRAAQVVVSAGKPQ